MHIKGFDYTMVYGPKASDVSSQQFLFIYFYKLMIESAQSNNVYVLLAVISLPKQLKRQHEHPSS